MSPRPTLTVAICTRGGAERIGPALQSVLGQSDPPDEILVMDNAPTDDRTAHLVREQFPQVRYEVEPVPGLDFARNAVISATLHDVVAFLDDDARACAGWSAAVRSAFAEEPRLAVCCFRVTALRTDTEARALFEANGGLDRGPDSVHLPRDAARAINGLRGSPVAWATRIAIGCGMSLRRRDVLALGGFDPALDLGPALPGGGDCDMVWRLIAAGFHARYAPDVELRHDHREDMESVTRQLCGHQTALVAVLTKIIRQSGGGDRWSAFRFLCWRLAKPGFRIVKRVIGQDPLPVAILARMWWACWKGLIAYPRAQRIAQRRVAAGAPNPAPTRHSAFRTEP